ncbi:MAG: transposase [Candidatus Nealsonbacteria bacterium]|nr:transposase [Candidatus Nealsonbacteria bacterium]
MPYRKQPFETGKIYHVVTRSLDNNLLFKNTNDYYRGIFSIYEFNTTKAIKIRERRKARVKEKQIIKNTDPTCVTIDAIDKRDLLVEIIAFCLMPNHIHLLLRQTKKDGIVKFMAKFGSGYASYFNKKYGRKGYVFQNRFRSVEIKNNEQLKIVFAYIHINPTSIIISNWKEEGIKDINKVLEFIENYKWSSYSDYLGKINFPSVSNRKFILELFGNKEKCKRFVDAWVRYKAKIKIEELFIE